MYFLPHGERRIGACTTSYVGPITVLLEKVYFEGKGNRCVVALTVFFFFLKARLRNIPSFMLLCQESMPNDTVHAIWVAYQIQHLENELM